MGTRISARTDRPWGPPSLLYNGYQVFPGGRDGKGVGLTPHPHLVPKVLEQSRAIPLTHSKSLRGLQKRVKTYLDAPDKDHKRPKHVVYTINTHIYNSRDWPYIYIAS